MRASSLMDLTTGLIDNRVFSGDMHDREQRNVFGTCWLFLGLDSLIARPGDYFTTYMGEDPVIVQRDAAGKIRVYLNRCRHRGAELCIFDSGNARSFTCSYHGWTYADGALVGVPHRRDAYRNEIDLSTHGLFEAPKVSVYGGLIFAC